MLRVWMRQRRVQFLIGITITESMTTCPAPQRIEGKYPSGGADCPCPQKAEAAVHVLSLPLRAPDPQSRPALVQVRVPAVTLLNGQVQCL